jgi:cytochrome c oxidase assembly protein subunit 15
MTHRLACVTALATLVLIVAGGLVTNTGAALAVPDWPTTFGHNMFLFPWAGMVGGVFYEHSHRLLGAAVGLLTVALAAAVWLTEARRWVRLVAAAAVVAVCVQGLLGGLRVLLRQDVLAIVHGCLAQAFFALVVALAVFTSPRWTATQLPPGGPRGLSRLAVAATAALYGQIVLGALTTHAGWVRLHLAGAAVATLAAGALAVRLAGREAPRAAALGRPAGVLGLLLAVQLALGLGAYVARFTGLAAPGGALGTLLFPVAHRVTASLLLGTALALALALWRPGRAATAVARPRARAAALSTEASA